MGIEVVLDDNHAVRVWKADIHETLHAVGPINGGAPVGDRDLSPVQKGSEEHEQVAHPVAFILRVIAEGMAGRGG